MDDNTPDNVPLTISLSKGFETVISAEDKPLAAFKWSACVGKHRTYAVRSLPGDNTVKIYLGREVLKRMLDVEDLAPGQTCRFKNGNPLDCRRENIELITKTVRVKAAI